jgi:hypothetical protein
MTAKQRRRLRALRTRAALLGKLLIHRPPKAAGTYPFTCACGTTVGQQWYEHHVVGGLRVDRWGNGAYLSPRGNFFCDGSSTDNMA